LAVIEPDGATLFSSETISSVLKVSGKKTKTSLPENDYFKVDV